MNELDKFLSDFYSKYSPGSLNPQKINSIKAGYGNNYDRLITDLYTKYAPDKLPDSDKLSQIKQGYGLVPIEESNSEQKRKLAIQQPVEGPGWFGKLGSTLTNDIPQMGSSAIAALEGLNRDFKQNRSGGGVERPERATFITGELEPMEDYLYRLDEWTKYHDEHAGEIKRSKELQTNLLKYAQKQKLEAVEDTRGSVKRLDQVHSFMDAMDWLGTATSQAVAHIPASAVTYGASSVLAETGEIYLSAVEKIAEDKSKELGRPVSIEEIIENGWDDPASAWAYGTVAGALDYIGAKGATAGFSKGQAIKEIKQRGLDILRSGGVEGLTEGSQSIIEQVGASRGANKTWSEAFSTIDPKDILESAAQGVAGGGAISTAGNIKGAVSSAKKEAPKKSEQLQAAKTIDDNLALGATLAKEEAKIDELKDEATVAPAPEVAAQVDEQLAPIVEDTQDDLDILAKELVSSQQKQEEEKQIDETRERESSIDELETKIADLKSKLSNSNKEDAVKVRKELKEVRRQYTDAVAENDKLNYESDKAEFEANNTSEQLDQMSNEAEFLASPEGQSYVKEQTQQVIEPPTTITQPTKNDSENQTGVPSAEQGKEAPIEVKPKPSRGKAKTTRNRVLQEPKQVVPPTEPIKTEQGVVAEEDESDLGPAEPLYQPKKKEVKKAEKPKKESDTLSELEKEVSSTREKNKIASLKAYRKSIDEFEANPSYESLNSLKDLQKKIKEELSKGRTDTYDLEITREQKKLDSRISSLEYSPKVKDAVREGKKAASSAEREVAKSHSAVEKSYKEVVKLREAAQKKALKAAEKRLGGSIDPSNATSVPLLKEDQQSIDKWKQSAENAIKKYEELSGKKITKKEKENLERYGSFESEEERALRAIQNSLEDLSDEDTDTFQFKRASNVGNLDSNGKLQAGNKFLGSLEYIEDPKSINTSFERPTYNQDFIDAFELANKLRAAVKMRDIELFISPSNLYVTEKGVPQKIHGLYSPGNAIIISKEALTTTHTALHEAIHPITTLFASIADLNLPQNKEFNKFKEELNDTYLNAKDQISKLVSDLLSNNKVDSNAHQAVLQYFETPTQEAFKKLYEDKTASEVLNDIYGLTNSNELVSEAFSDSGFTNILVNIPDAKAKNTAKAHSVLYKIAKNILDFLTLMYERVFDTKNTSFQRILDLVSDFEVALKSGEIVYDNLTKSLIEKERHLEFAKATSKNNSLPKKFINQVVEQAFEKGIFTLKDFKKYLADLNIRITSKKGIPLDRGQVKELVDSFKERSQLDNLITAASKEVETTVYASKRYQTSPHFQDQVDQLMSIDPAAIEPRDRRTYYDALSGIVNGVVTEDLAKIHTKYKAKERVETIAKTKGFGYRQLSDESVRIKNPAQIVSDMSKHVTKNADSLMETMYFNVMRSHARASVATKKQLQAIIDLVKEERLVRDDYLKAGIYGLLLRTSVAPDVNNPAWSAEIRENIEYLKATQKEKAMAVALGNEKRWDKKDVEKETSFIKEFETRLDAGTPLDQLLNPAQMRLYNQFRQQLEELKPDIAENTNAYWGQRSTTRWQEQYNYFPARVVGRNELAVLNDEAEAFKDILMNEDKDYGNVQSVQARYSKAFNKSKKAYLDLNLLSVAESYLQATNYDLFTTKELRVLNSVLKNKDTAATLGSKNIRVIRDSLTCHIKAATGRHYNFGKVVRGLEAIKDQLVVAKLGTTGQWFTQLLGQIPAIATFTSPNNAIKAGSTLASFQKMYGKSFDTWIEEHGAGLQIRDLFFETEQAVHKYSRDTRNKIIEVADKSTRWSLKQSDRLAARLVYVAAFIEAGGDFNNPSKEALVHAERKTILSQNVSDLSFAPSIFRPETSTARVFLSAVMPFKSFSLQQMLNTYRAIADFNESPEAKKLLAANVLSTVGYTVAQATAVKWLYTTLFAPFFATAQAAVAEAIGLEDWAEALRSRDDEDDEKSYGFWEGVFVNSILDLFFSGAPLQVEKLLDYTYNTFLAPNIASARNSSRDYNQYLDSPVITPGSADQLLFSMFGGYQEIASFGTGVAGNGLGWTSDQLFQVFSDDYISKPEDEFPVSTAYRLLMVDMLSGVPFLPFRGDIVKTNRDLARELKSQEFGKSKASSTFRKPGLKRSTTRRSLQRGR